MPFFPRTEEEIVREGLSQLEQNTNISQTAPGSKARFFLTTMAREQASQQALFDSNLLQPYIRYAEGKFLDFFGDMLALPRINPAHAETVGNNFMFYVDTGTFGDINSGATFSIPSGTQVYTVPPAATILTPGISDRTLVRYVTTETVSCNSAQAFVYCPLRAVLEGEGSNIPRESLTGHAFTSYSNSASKTLKCTNRHSIDTGTSRETDESYRYRLSTVFRAQALGIQAAIRLAALSVPGVSDVREYNSEQGPGSYTLYVMTTTSTTSQNIINQVANAVAQVTAYGIRPYIVAPKTLSVDFIAAVRWSSKATATDKEAGYVAAKIAVEKYLNSLSMGSIVVISDLIGIIANSAPLIVAIGKVNPGLFEEVYVYKEITTSGKLRSKFSGTQINPLYNERVILETGTRHRGIQFIEF